MQETILRTHALRQLQTCLSESPAVALLGARQTGKTTLARMAAGFFGNVRWFDLERAADRRALEAPEQTLGGEQGLVVIDEVQRLPELFEVLRPLCDRPGHPARFLLLGSASPLLLRGVSETLAGRVLFVRLGGFTLQDVGDPEQSTLWLRGGFPRAFLAGGSASWGRWIDAYLTAILERDIPLLGFRMPPETLRRFWMMLAHYHGQVWNAAEAARALGCSPNTARHYLDILQGFFMVRVLPPWFENLGKRQVKAPKLYLRDAGLLHRLLGCGSMAALRSHPRLGASWEGFAIEQILALAGEGDAYFWATQAGAELDLMLVRGGRRIGFEFKHSDAPTMTRSMHTAVRDLALDALHVVYPGATRYAMSAGVDAVPLHQLPMLAAQEGWGEGD
jgi:uncharacterized protein